MQTTNTATCSKSSETSPSLFTVSQAVALFDLPFFELLWRAHTIHREHFNPNQIQRSALFSIKTGGCSEDCKYCSQSARNDANLPREPLKPLDEVLTAAKSAKASGASRFCMGAAWRSPKDRDLDAVITMVKEVKALGLETCLTLGMLKLGQAEQLKEAGLDYYNHNLDTDAEFYPTIVSTHQHSDRINTIDQVRQAGIKICSGGIVGMGETRQHRAGLLIQFANMQKPPESLPINNLVAIPGSPLAEQPKLDNFEFIRTIAVARILMPNTVIRLSAGRQEMNDEMQSLCFFAGANSVFYGNELLTTGNVTPEDDIRLFQRLGLTTI